MRTIKYINFFLMLLLLGMIMTGCPSDSPFTGGGDGDGGGGEEASPLIDKVDIQITLSCSGSLPANNTLLLLNEAGVTISTVKADIVGTIYTLPKLDVQFLNQTYRVYSLYMFTDGNANGIYDSTEAAEKNSYRRIDTINMSQYSGSAMQLVYKINNYGGTVVFHSGMGADPLKRYILFNNPSTGENALIPVNADNTFSFLYVRGSIEYILSVYALYDSNGDGQAGFLEDKIAFIMTQSNQAENTHINAEIVKAYGKLEFDDPVGYFDFDSTTNKPVLRVEDRTYYRQFFQGIGTDGSFDVYITKNHNADIILYHVSDSINPESYSDDYQNYLTYPVRIAGDSAGFSADKEIWGIGGTGVSMKIHTISIKVQNPLTGYEQNNLYVKYGRVPIAAKLLIDDNTTVAASQDATGTTYRIFFRDFDRSTTTYGIFNDEPHAQDPTGLMTLGNQWGPPFTVAVFIDVNGDGLHNPEEPSSNTFSHGANSADYNENSSADRTLWTVINETWITSDKDFTATTLVLAEP